MNPMNSHRKNWRTESSSFKRTASGTALLLIGFAVVIACHQVNKTTFSTELAALMLGGMLALIGSVMLIFGGNEVIILEPRSRRIRIENKSIFGRQTKEINFSEITGVQLGELGDNEGGTVRYYVALILNTKEEVALFLGFYEGACDKQTMEARCNKLRDYLVGA